MLGASFPAGSQVGPKAIANPQGTAARPGAASISPAQGAAAAGDTGMSWWCQGGTISWATTLRKSFLANSHGHESRPPLGS